MTITIVTIPIEFDEFEIHQKYFDWQQREVEKLDDLLEDGYQVIHRGQSQVGELVFATFILRKWRLQPDVDRTLRLRLDGPVGTDSVEDIPDWVMEAHTQIPHKNGDV